MIDFSHSINVFVFQDSQTKGSPHESASLFYQNSCFICNNDVHWVNVIWYGKQELCRQALGGWDWDQKDNWPSHEIINYSVEKKDLQRSFYVFYCFLVFCTKEQIWHTEIHSLVTVLLLCFLNASSNISRMALEYTQKLTLFLLIKDTLSDDQHCMLWFFLFCS